MHRRTDTSGARGFTLLELIVTISILGVVTSIGMNAFNQLTTAWTDVRAESDLNRQADND